MLWLICFLCMCTTQAVELELSDLLGQLNGSLMQLDNALNMPSQSTIPVAPPPPATTMPTTPAPIPGTPPAPSIPSAPPMPGIPTNKGLILEGQIISKEDQDKSDQEITRILTLVAYQKPVTDKFIETLEETIKDLKKSGSFRYYAGSGPQELAQKIKAFIDNNMRFDNNEKLLKILQNFEQGRYQLSSFFTPYLLDNTQEKISIINTLCDLIIIKIVGSQRKTQNQPAPSQEEQSDEIFLKALDLNKGLTIDESIEKPTAEQARELIIKKLMHLIMHPDYLKFSTIINQLPKASITVEKSGNIFVQLSNLGQGAKPFSATDSLIRLLQKPTGIIKINQLNNVFLGQYLFNPDQYLDNIKDMLRYPISGSKVVIVKPIITYQPLADAVMSLENKLDILEFLDACIAVLGTSSSEKFKVKYRQYRQSDINVIRTNLSQEEKDNIDNYITEYKGFSDTDLKGLLVRQRLMGLRLDKYKNINMLIEALAPYTFQTLYVSLTKEIYEKLKKNITAANLRYMQRYYFNIGVGSDMSSINTPDIPFNQYMRYLRDNGVLTKEQVKDLQTRPIDTQMYYFVQSIKAYNAKK